MTKTEAETFLARWAAVNTAEIAELRATSAEQKLWQLAALMMSVEQLGWNEALAQEESQVRELWRRIRKAYLA